MTQLGQKLVKTVDWFHAKHPELSKDEILDIVENIIKTISEGEAKPLGNGYNAFTFKNIPWSVPDKDIQDLADIITELIFPELIFPSKDMKVH